MLLEALELSYDIGSEQLRGQHRLWCGNPFLESRGCNFTPVCRSISITVKTFTRLAMIYGHPSHTLQNQAFIVQFVHGH